MSEDPTTNAPEPLEPVEGEPGWAPDDPHAEPAEPVATEPVRTGVDRVDEVIRAVEELEERPIEEHVGVFESAQVQLRRALDPPDGRDGVDDQPDHPGQPDHR